MTGIRLSLICFQALGVNNEISCTGIYLCLQILYNSSSLANCLSLKIKNHLEQEKKVKYTYKDQILQTCLICIFMISVSCSLYFIKNYIDQIKYYQVTQKFTVQKVISTSHSLELQKICSLTRLMYQEDINKTKLQELYIQRNS